MTAPQAALMGAARKTLERLARGRVLRRRLPAAVGGRPLYVSPDSALSFLRAGDAAFDTMLLKLARRLVKPSSVVWDVGANVGVFTFAAAALASKGTIVAVEPDPFLAGLLRRSSRLKENAGSDVRVLSAAISDRDGVAELSIAGRGRSANTIAGAAVGTQRGGVREAMTVPTLTLDTLLGHFGAPQVVKIDVEGAEAMVMRGAARLLAEARPTLVIEVSRTNVPAVSSALVAARYALYDAESDAAEPERRETCAWNTLAIPLETA